MALVIDNGSEFMKVGIVGDAAPKATFRSVVGRPKGGGQIGVDEKDVFVGDDALAKRDTLILRTPIERGMITNWDDMEQLWHYAFYTKLSIAPEEYSVLLTEPPLNPVANRERTVQIMFETFFVPAMFISTKAVLSLNASGLTTGCALISGGGTTCAVPVIEGIIVANAVSRLDVAGKDLTEYLIKILNEKGSKFTVGKDNEVVRGVMESLCYVALDFDKEMKTAAAGKTLEKTSTLPGGAKVVLNNERFRCPEVLFQPKLMGPELDGVATITNSSIMMCDADAQAGMFANIVLSGECTAFPGFAARMTKDVSALAESMKVTIMAPPDCKVSAWIGGSKLAGLPTFQEMWITRPEYDEEGPSIVARKCP